MKKENQEFNDFFYINGSFLLHYLKLKLLQKIVYSS